MDDPSQGKAALAGRAWMAILAAPALRGARGRRDRRGRDWLPWMAAVQLNGLIGSRQFDPDRFRRRAAPAPLAEDRGM